MTDECNWISNMLSGVEPFGVTFTMVTRLGGDFEQRY
jgi:hypothetical protein